jgi:hypothetical protein
LQITVDPTAVQLTRVKSTDKIVYHPYYKLSLQIKLESRRTCDKVFNTIFETARRVSPNYTVKRTFESNADSEIVYYRGILGIIISHFT